MPLTNKDPEHLAASDYVDTVIAEGRKELAISERMRLELNRDYRDETFSCLEKLKRNGISVVQEGEE